MQGARTANLPPRGGDARQGRGGRCPASVSVLGCHCPCRQSAANPASDKPRSFAPPSVLPDISPTRGEIS
ncbi:MAG: hypothetical protein EOQ50_32155 [Mesorhizobium sp.]|nr:MAG: hypothetical protein EOQ50_32155 [Mesorhizobium sp.]RWL83604.1 MAG: hypothetical protein EOR69_12720 [Mesorhizobium sp.]RWL90755.1 MAG: hypothetical protein EOR67_05060 [Mesorhizobium sp.]RWL93242.1 MAG: hypothetical protein EOR70_28730 [Mesorhizobium sp.]TJV69985.1 MAG: hypothetical protein E5X76_22295 [Mesorhizobium sp.]